MSFLFNLPPEADRVVIGVNPRAGRGTRLHYAERLATLLAARGFHAEIVTDLSEIDQRAIEHHAAGRLRALVAAGGDGTNAELVNRTPQGVPLALLPLGTENLLAKYLRLPMTPEGTAECIADGHVARLDAGRAGERIFLLMVDAGFDAEVVNRLHGARKGNISRLSYIKPILGAIRSYEYPEMRLYCDRDGAAAPNAAADPVVVRWAFLFNLPCYAMGLKFTPAAVGTDAMFDLCGFTGSGFWKGMKYLMGVITGGHVNFSDCVTARVRRVRFESDHPTPYQLDGDHGGMLPLDVEILPQRLSLLVPSAWAAAQKNNQ